MFRSTLGGVALCLLVTNAGAAQQAEVARYEAMVAELDARHQTLIETADQLDALLATASNTTTIDLAGMTITVPMEYADAARDAARLATPRLRARFGRAFERVSGMAARVDVSIREIDFPTGRFNRVMNGIPSNASRDGRNRYVTVRLYSGEQRLSSGGALNMQDLTLLIGSRFEQGVAAVLQSQVNPAFLEWSGDKFEPLPTWGKLRRDRNIPLYRAVYGDIVNSRFAATRTCRTDAAACLGVLGLVESADLASAWYPGDDLRLLAVGWNRGGTMELTEADLDRMAESERTLLTDCNDGRRQSCAQFLVGLDISPPATPKMRASLLETAFRMGGEGGTHRLLESYGTTRERLEQIAGAPVDQIVVEWLDTAQAAVGRSLTVPLKTGLMAVLWIGAFAGMGLRSTRWR